MATCTPMQSTGKTNQATLFSFMKKKVPNDVSDLQKQMNFVTPASNSSEVPHKADDKEGAGAEGDKDSIEQNPDIDRLVSCGANSASSKHAPSSPVVDLTAEEEAPAAKVAANVVSAAKKRKSPAVKAKAPAPEGKSISAAFAAAKETPSVFSPSKAATVEVVEGVVVVDEKVLPADTTALVAEPVADQTFDAADPAPTAVKVTPVPKKRARKPSTKKTEAVESAALDTAVEGEATSDAMEATIEKTDPEDQEDKAGKPAAKRVRKAPAAPTKPAPMAMVYPPHVEVKLQSNREKLSNLVAELCFLESCADCQDSDLEVAQAVDAVLAAAENLPVEVTASTDVSTSVAVPTAASMDSDAAPAGEDAGEVAEPMTVEEPTKPAPTEVDSDAHVPADGDAVVPVDDAAPVAVPELTAPVVLTAEDRAKATVNGLVRSVIARCVQGKSAPLKELVTSTMKVITGLQQRLNALPAKEFAEDSAMDVVQDAVAVPVLDSRQIVGAIVLKYTDAAVLSEEIKSLAVRQSHGNRTDKASMFDCTDSLAVWRWEAHSVQHFSKSAQNTIREVRSVRGRYSRALKAVYRVLEQQSKQPYSEVKVAPLEERAVKALAEVEKAKERRREVEAKRAADAEDKRRKEEQKEQKRLEKEEARRVAAEAAAAAKAALPVVEKEKKAPVVNEKAQKKAAELEKAKNAFMSFLKPVSSSAATSSTAAKISAAPVSASVSAAASTSSATAPAAISVSEDEKLAKFEAAMKSEMAMSDIMKYQRERYQNRTRARKSRRPTHIELHVTVIVPDPRARSGFDTTDNTYSEIQEKRFHNKIRTLAFWEDHRPAYVGTVSRTSRVISARRPLARDTELLNYEYDSEEDWEEEVEGEDLNETDEEEEEGGSNELEYDDFFCRDDDYGSDAEGDMGVPLKVCHKNVIEVFGPRYLNPATLPALLVDPTKEEVPTLRRCDEPISTFTIFDLSTGEMVTRSAKQDADSANLSMYSAVSFATYPTPVLGQFETKKLSQQGGTSSAAEITAEAKPAPVPKGFDESKLLDLVKFIHGKKEGVDKLVAGFHEAHPTISKLQIQKRMKEITDKIKHADGYGTMRFLVKAEVLEALSLTSADLEEVIFTPQKKQKKRTPPSLIASSLEDLKSSEGTSAFPQPPVRAPIAAALAKVVPASPLVVASTAAAAPIAVTSPAPPAAAQAKPQVQVQAASSSSVVKAKKTAPSAAGTDSVKKTGAKRKCDAEASGASAPKSAKKPPTAPKAAVTPAASTTTSTITSTTTSVATSSKPLTSIFGKITTFMVSPSPSAATPTAQPAQPQAVSSSPLLQDNGVKTAESPPQASQIIEIDMD